MANELKEAFLRSWFDVPEGVHWAHGMSNEVEKEVSESFDRSIAAMNTRPAAPVEGLGRFSLAAWSEEPTHHSYIETDPVGEYVRFDQAEAIIALLNAQIEIRDQGVDALSKRIEKAEAILAAKDAKIADLENELSSFRSSFKEQTSLKADNTALTARVKELEAECDEFADRLNQERKSHESAHNRTKDLEKQLAAAKRALKEAVKIAFDVSKNGEYHGEASVDSTSSIYRQGAFEVYETIRARIILETKP